jgi:alpha-glucosidase (family GH31 glycosyl hydrolase)
VDLSNPAAYGWLLGELRGLERLYGLDGFKLDAGDAEYLPATCTTFGHVTPNRYTDLFASLGRHFAVNELRVSWRAQSFGLVERLRDKNNDWSLERGLGALVPHELAEHRHLGDYVFALARRAQSEGTPIARPLFFRNPEDEATYAIRDQFLLGDRFLVAPMLKKGAVARDVYLPAGLWKDFWSGRLYEGPRTLEDYPAPIDTLPIFVDIH